MLAARPFSLRPSIVAMSHPAVVTLPYLEVQVRVPGPPAPSRLSPRGYIHRCVPGDPIQSLERVVTIVPFGPSYMAREHDSAGCVGVSVARVAMTASASLRRGLGLIICGLIE